MTDAPAIAAAPTKPFVPLNAPPTDGHTLNTGLSTELGDSAKTAFEKINAGFAHLYSIVTGTPPIGTTATASTDVVTQLLGRVRALESKPIVTDVSQVAKEDFDAVAAKVKELEGKLATAAPVQAVETVAKEDFDALKAKFDILTSKLGHLFDLEPVQNAPPPA